MNAVFLPDLANSAVAREIRITEHGQSNAVLAADREAVEVFATLASSDSARYRDSWERAVNTVAVDLKHRGRSQPAIADERRRLGLRDCPPPARRSVYRSAQASA